jgi:tetratricopeptide (TPR) repeat protein
MAMDDAIIHAEARDKTIITQYFQDLYRFYKLHPLKAEFDDLFNLSNSLYDARFFNVWINDIHVLRNIGEFYFEKNHYKDALQIFLQIVDKMKHNELYENAGYCYQQLSDFEHALEMYHKAELYGKPRIWLLNKIAYCTRKSGDPDGAVRYCREAEKMEPENLEIQAFLGQTLMEMEDYSEALRYYFKVEYLQPDNYKVYRPISWCAFMQGKYDTAKKYLDKAIEQNATKHDHMNMGHINWCLGLKQEAIQSYMQSLHTSNKDTEWFKRVLSDDGRFLVQKGIRLFDIALMQDYIRMSTKS